MIQVAKHTKLSPGATAAIYRRGDTMQLLQLPVPPEGNFKVRELAPGEYTARDTTGQEVDFDVSPFEAETVVPVKGAEPEPEPNDDPPSDEELEGLYATGVLERPVEPDAE